MAESRTATAPVSALRGFAVIAGAWIRSSLTYRTSFVVLTLTNLAVTALDFVVILVMFSQVDTLGGLGLPQVAVLYGMAGLALGLADLLVGNLERVGARVRDGSLDLMLVRPVPAIVQLAADRFALRRIGRVAQSVPVLTWGLAASGVEWTPGRVLVLVLAVLAGTTIFVSVFVLGGAFQIYAGDAAEVANAFTYGGATLLQYPLSIYPAEVVRTVTFVLPLAFVSWYPALYVLGLDDPTGMPRWLQPASPVAAGLFVLAACLGWRAALTRYRSTGS